MSYTFTITEITPVITVSSTSSNVIVTNTSSRVTVSTNATVYGEQNYGSIDASIIPSQDLTYDLGSPTKQWRSLYVGTATIYIDNVPVSVNANNELLVDGKVVLTSTTATNGVFGTIETNGVVNSGIAYTASSTGLTVDTWNGTNYKSAKYFIQVSYGNELQVLELVLVYDGTNVYKSEYGVIQTGSLLGTFTASLESGNVSLVYSTNGNKFPYKLRVNKTLMAA